MIVELIDVQPYDEHRMFATVDITSDDGTTVRNAHVIPYDAAEWRIAEYELDPADPATADTVVDILLWEGHVHPEIPEDKRLYAAATSADARDALLGAIKTRKAKSDAGKQARRAGLRGAADPAAAEANARARLVGLCVVDAEVVAAKQEHVRRTRDNLAQVQRSAPASASERLAALNTPAADKAKRQHDREARNAAHPNN